MAQARLSNGIDARLQESLLGHLGRAGLLEGDRAEECLRHVCLLSKAFAEVASLRTAEVIKAMFVLPLEIRRQKAEVLLKEE